MHIIVDILRTLVYPEADIAYRCGWAVLVGLSIGTLIVIVIAVAM